MPVTSSSGACAHINAADDAGTLHDRLAQIGARLLVRTVDLIAQGARRVTRKRSPR